MLILIRKVCVAPISCLPSTQALGNYPSRVHSSVNPTFRFFTAGPATAGPSSIPSTRS